MVLTMTEVFWMAFGAVFIVLLGWMFNEIIKGLMETLFDCEPTSRKSTCNKCKTLNNSQALKDCDCNRKR
jgi:hypothetical protein